MNAAHTRCVLVMTSLCIYRQPPGTSVCVTNITFFVIYIHIKRMPWPSPGSISEFTILSFYRILSLSPHVNGRLVMPLANRNSFRSWYLCDKIYCNKIILIVAKQYIIIYQETVYDHILITSNAKYKLHIWNIYIYMYFLHAKPWIPSGEKSLFTVVIH